MSNKNDFNTAMELLKSALNASNDDEAFHYVKMATGLLDCGNFEKGRFGFSRHGLTVWAEQPKAAQSFAAAILAHYGIPLQLVSSDADTASDDTQAE